MKYITSHELSEKWGISQRRIVLLAGEGRIDGARLYGRSWMFPEDAAKPIDGRTKEVRSSTGSGIGGRARYACVSQNNASENFRCPIFEFRDEASFDPPLSRDELTIKAVNEALVTCRYEEAKEFLSDLPYKAEDKYIRIAALYYGCMCAICLCEDITFYNYFGRLLKETSGEFPHKAEMEEYVHQINAALGDNTYYASWPHTDLTYPWHKSFLPRLSNLSNVWLATGENRPGTRELAAAEYNLLLIEDSGALFDQQALHIYLGCAYATEGMIAERDYHFIKALRLAEKYDMFFTVAQQYYYICDEFQDALLNFSHEFRSKIEFLGNDIHERFLRFAKKTGAANLYVKISDNDYILISFALQGLTYKEISQRLRISESSVARRYSRIYESLGVSNKSEMLKMLRG